MKRLVEFEDGGGEDEKSSESGIVFSSLEDLLMGYIWDMTKEKDSGTTSRFHLTSLCQFSVFH